jgi:hypothetical protein
VNGGEKEIRAQLEQSLDAFFEFYRNLVWRELQLAAPASAGVPSCGAGNFAGSHLSRRLF